MTITKILISPAYAEQLLCHNTQNRKPNRDFVYRYANDMVEGRWNENTGETIKIANDGTIIDGQHRLMAVVKANKAVYFHVVNGVDKSVMTVIDTGKSRNATDVFAISQIDNYNKIPSTISMYESLKLGAAYATSTTRKVLTNEVVLSRYNDRPDYWQSVVKKTYKWYIEFAKIVQPSVIGGLYATFDEIDADMAESFFDMLSTGIDVKNKSILLLRNKLIQDKTSVRKMQFYVKVALIIKTWNFYRANEQVKIIKFNPSVEEFPTPQ